MTDESSVTKVSKTRLARELPRPGRRVSSTRETRLSTRAKARRLAAGSILVKKQALEAGCNAYLTKPVDDKHFLKELSRIITSS